MKILILIGSILLPVIGVYAQCAEPVIENTGDVIASKTFSIEKASADGEMFLSLEASAKNASWGKKEAEAAVLTIFVDGKYNQDVMLFAGAEKYIYKIILGNFAEGKHPLKIVFNKSRSAQNVNSAKIYRTEIKPLTFNSPEDRAALVNLPMLYLRPDTIDKFSDIPLITYYEILPGENSAYKIRYTTIFTNEDGGTQTRALMARWGRATDIEWFYEAEAKNGKILSEIIQGANHVTKNFGGKRIFGSHPVIFDITNNNNFDDAGCSQLRTALLPVRTDLSERSRETVMDSNSWTYRIMAQEAVREGRVDPNNIGVNVIDDLRNYLYVEVHSQNNASSIALEAQTTDGKTNRSDMNDARLRIERNGYQRIAIRIPSAASLRSLSLLCEPSVLNKTSGECRDSRIVKFLRLDKDYKLLEIQNPAKNFRSLKIGEKLTWAINGH